MYLWVWEFTHKYLQIRQKYRTKYGFVIDFIFEGTDGSQRNSRRRRCAAILLSTEQTNKKGKLGLPFNLYIATLFNLHEWIVLACYEAIEVSYAALIWLLFLAMGDIEVVIAE